MALTVGGVPEHFNMPWHMAIENDLFKSSGVDVTWKEFKGGTGAMCKALRQQDVDVCVILTEGIIKDIFDGNNSRIISKYISTPLIWGVHTGANSNVNYYGEIFDKQIAISRKGSGSDLMPRVDAMIKDKKVSDEQFVIIKNLEGALESLEKNETEVFYWEKYTTKPYVDSGRLRSLGEFVTPWPCFVIAASEKAIEEKKEELESMLECIHFVCGQFIRIPDIINRISKRYNLLEADVENWFHSTEWASNSDISSKMIDNVTHYLKKSGLISRRPIKEELIIKL